MEKLPYIAGSGKIRIGDDVFLSGKSSFIVGNKLCDSSVLEIGNNSKLGHGCDIVVGLRVSIGNNVMIASGTTIRDNDGHPLDALERRQGLPVRREDIQPVEIRDDVWIGAHAYIGRGVVIGERSIIGAYATVRKSVPPDSIVIGNPARVAGKVNDQLIKQSEDS
jgi:acetyltransferase-like isoleucine patch superfamily enzyme